MLGALAMLVSGCGGGGAGGAITTPSSPAVPVITTLGCAPNLEQTIAPGQRLLNNTWNSGSAAGFAWSQCLLKQTMGAAVAYGWQWVWPSSSDQVLAYPEVVMGAKPWDGGPGNDARFPRRLADTPSLLLSYDVQTTHTGDHNLATSMWFTRGAQTGSEPAFGAIAAELMVWSDYTPAMVSGGGPVTLRGEVALAGRVWQVWAAEGWRGGDAAGVPARWNFIVYTAKDQRTTSLSVDLRVFIDDALVRGLLTADLHLASVELGNEVVSGSGQTIVKSLSLTMP